jgi:hypothetical protein
MLLDVSVLMADGLHYSSFVITTFLDLADCFDSRMNHVLCFLQYGVPDRETGPSRVDELSRGDNNESAK